MTNRLLVSLFLCAVAGDGPRASDGVGARIFRDPAAGTLVIDLAPTDLPANTPHHMIAQPPVATLEIPETGSIYGFRVGVVDSAGRWLPDEMIHHFNLIDPDHRELFLPISRRLLAAGRETGTIHLPWMLFGLPLKRGEHVVASAMIENLTATSYRGARVRLAMDFTPTGRCEVHRQTHPRPTIARRRQVLDHGACDDVLASLQWQPKQHPRQMDRARFPPRREQAPRDGQKELAMVRIDQVEVMDHLIGQPPPGAVHHAHAEA